MECHLWVLLPLFNWLEWFFSKTSIKQSCFQVAMVHLPALDPLNHRENGGNFGMVPLICQPHIHFISRAYLLGISPFKGLLGG